MAVNIWKSYMCTAVKETNIELILAVMNTELVVEIGPEKIQIRSGFEPMTFAILLSGSAEKLSTTSCISPYTSFVH